MSSLTLVKDWLQSHPTATSLMISKELNMPIEESRRLLAEAVEVLGSNHYKLTYVTKSQDTEGNILITFIKARPQHGALLHSVQRKTDFSSSVFLTEQKIKRLRLEDSSSMNALYHDMSAKICPLKQETRNVFPSQRGIHKSFSTASAPQTKLQTQPIKETLAFKKEEAPSKSLPEPPKLKEKPSCIKTGTPRSPAKGVHSVRFEQIPNEKPLPLKRKYTPYPHKTANHINSLDDIMAPEEIEVEEVDDFSGPTVHKRMHSPDKTSVKRIQSASPLSIQTSSEPTEPSTTAQKSYSQERSRVYVNDAGTLGMFQVVAEDIPKEKPQKTSNKPQSHKAVIFKKSTQMSLG